MTGAEALKILNGISGIRTINENQLESSLDYLDLNSDGGIVYGHFAADELRAIAYWLDHPEEFSERTKDKDA